MITPVVPSSLEKEQKRCKEKTFYFKKSKLEVNGNYKYYKTN